MSEQEKEDWYSYGLQERLAENKERRAEERAKEAQQRRRAQQTLALLVGAIALFFVRLAL